MKSVALSALVVFAATPALAQTKVHKKEYYVIHDSGTKTCTIVDKRPTTTINAINTLASPSTIVGLGVFHTQAEAEAAMKRMYVCGKEDVHNERLIQSH